MGRAKIIVLLVIWALLAGCSQTPVLPTPVPTAAQPSAVPLATIELAATATPGVGGTNTPLPTATVPTPSPSPTATPVLAPVLSINNPAEGSNLLLGSETTIDGYVNASLGMIVRVGLVSTSGWALTSEDATVTGSTWQVTLSVPAEVSGGGQVQVALLTESGEVLARDSAAVNLVADREVVESYLALYRPLSEDVAVAGHALYFDGRLQRSGGGTLVLSVRLDDCQREVAQYTVALPGSTYWYAYLILPPDEAGPACAVAFVGEPGEEGWYAAEVPMTVLGQDAAEAIGVMIANPFPGRRAIGGETITVNGVAYNAPSNEVQIRVELPDGRLVAETAVLAGRYGQWGAEITLPIDLDGEASIIATLGDPLEPLARAERIISVVPGAAATP